VLDDVILSLDSAFAVVRYHTWWPSASDPFYLANVEENTVRTRYYQPDTAHYVPRLFIDGLIDGEYTGPWEELIAARDTVESPLELTGEVVPSGGIDVDLILVGTESDLHLEGPLRLRYVLTESDVYVASPTGPHWYDQAMRDMVPDAEGVEVEIGLGDTVYKSQTFPVDEEWNIEELEVVVFVQRDDSTREVLQTGKWPVPSDVPNLSLVEVTLLDPTGDGDGRAEEGEEIELVLSLVNTQPWLDASTVSATLRETDASLTLIDSTADFGAIAAGDTIDNAASPITFSVADYLVPHRSHLTLHIEAEPGGYAADDTFSLMIGHPQIMVVDDDGGAAFEASYGEIMAESLDLFFEEWVVAEQGSPMEWLLNSELVVWFTGDDSTETLTADDRAHLAAFLGAGGKLFIAGQNIGQDIGTEPFYHDYLHAAFVDPATADAGIFGVAGDPVWGGAIIINEIQQSKDIVTSTGDADSILIYQNGGVAGISYEGEYKVIYLAFGLEGMDESSGLVLHRDDVLSRALGWLGLPVEVSGGEEPRSGEATAPCMLRQSYPNPCRGRTVLSYVLGDAQGTVRRGRASTTAADHVRLTLYNIQGQRVRMLVDEPQANGGYALSWDGRDERGRAVSNGLYFVRLEARGESASRKVILLR
jgi:hypothetical protein